MKKKMMAWALAFSLCLSLLPASVSAETSGSCGENLTWTLVDGTLTISGTGTMTDWQSENEVPWNDVRESIVTVVIESGVTTTAFLAFRDCTNLTSVTIPASVTAIMMGFENCTKLTEIQVAAENTDYASVDGVLFSKNMNVLHVYPAGKSDTTYTIPSSVTDIQFDAFAYSGALTTVTIPTSVTYIGESAFAHCQKLSSVVIPNSVTIIGKDAFYSCPELASVTIPENLTSIGERFFRDCQSLTKVTIPASVTSIGGNAFTGCSSLEDILVENQNTVYASVDGVLCSKDETRLIVYPAGKSATTYTIPNSVTDIADGAFEYCGNLTSVIIPETVTTIGESTFRDCYSLTSMTIPNTVTTISDSMFMTCGGLLSVTLPSTLTAIGDYSFFQCSALNDIYFGGTEEQWHAVTIGEGNDLLTSVDIHYNSTGPDDPQTTYTVIWKDADGTVLETDTGVAYGATPSYDGAEPTKASTQTASYTFTGWTPEVTAVTSDATYTAVYQETALTYTITWKDADGTVLETDTGVAYGATPSYDGAEPTKASTQTTSYTFTGWTPEVTAVTSDATYTAVYQETALTYTITWKDADGTVLETDTGVAYGATPSYDGAEPTKASTQTMSYTFTGWTPEVTAVTSDATYTAVYQETALTYTITWKDADGTVLETDTGVAYGATPSYDGAVPTKQSTQTTSYTFTGWTPEVTAVTDDATYTAVYQETALTYTVTWKDADGTVLETDTGVAYGATPSYDGAEPTKASTQTASYTFTGWTPEVTAVTGDATYTAVYQEMALTYTITWKDADGTVLETDTGVAYGATPSYDGAEPTKASTQTASYTFTGWTPEVTAVTSDATYTAVYQETALTYTITWKDADGTVLETDTGVAYGATPSYDGAEPTKQSTQTTSYTFTGWTPEVTAVTSDATYTAVYQETALTYTITWKDADGTVLETDTGVAYGATPSYDGAEPSKPSTQTTSYTFTGWTPEIVAVTDDATYTAVYQETALTYTVTWKDADGTVLETDTGVAYGATPSYDGAEPTKASTQTASYTFTGWTPEVTAVTSDATYTAVYQETALTYTITWKDADGTVLETDTGVAYGATPSYDGAVPTKQSTQTTSYTFTGWTPDVSAVTGDAVYTAKYTQQAVTYTVTWKNDDGTVLETDEVVAAGTTPTYDGATPTKQSTAQYSYTFDDWTPDVSAVTGDVTYTATFLETLNTYTVTWKGSDGVVLETDANVPYGTTPSYDGETPKKAATTQYSYTFNGWTPEIIFVISDVTYTATFIETEITKKAWDYFSFSNSSSAFFNSNEVRNYSAGSYFDYFPSLLSQYYDGQKASNYLNNLRKQQSGSWGGSCYGFAALEGTVNHGYLSPSVIDSDANSLPEVDQPADNVGVRNLLNYYYLTQFIPALRGKQYDVAAAAGKQMLLKMAEDVIAGTPYMISYFFSGGGHAIILEGGIRLENGGYELIGQDNRFHGYTVCSRYNGRWIDTGEPMTVSVQIPADGSTCRIWLDKETRFTKGDGRVYYYPSSIDENVYRFEPVSTFEHFAAADPTRNAYNTNNTAQMDSNETGSVFYYVPNAAVKYAEDAFVLKDQDNQTIIDGSDLMNLDNDIIEESWYIIKDTIVSDDEQMDNTLLKSQLGVMARLNLESDMELTAENLKDATISYVSEESFAAVNAENVEAVRINTTDNTVQLKGNDGVFSISIASANDTVATVTGNAATETISATVSGDGITLDAPAGEYSVSFTLSDNTETTAVLTNESSGGTTTWRPKEKTTPVTPSTPSTPSTPTYNRGGSSGGISGGSTASSNQTVSVPVSGGNGSVAISASINGTTLAVTKISADQVSNLVRTSSENGTITIDLSRLSKDITATTIPTETIRALEQAISDPKNGASALEVKLPGGSAAFDAKALATITAQAKGGDIWLNLGKTGIEGLRNAQQETLNGKDIQQCYNIYLTSNGIEIRDFKGGTVELTMDYTLKTGQSATNVEMWYVSDDGKTVEEIPTVCDGKTVKSKVGHFSCYAIVYNPNHAQTAAETPACAKDKTCPISSFNDADPKAWYHDGVHYALENGIMNGMGGGVFSPNGTTSRAMLAQMLWNLEGKPAYVGRIEFNDVDAEAWYAPAIRWASAEGMITGYDDPDGSGRVFAPDAPLTREQLVTILYRFAKAKGVDVRANDSLSAYTDAGSVSAWAADAMQWAVGTGLVAGKTAKTLNPADSATRAEIATIMMRYCENIAK